MDRVDGVWDSWLGGCMVGTKEGHRMDMVYMEWMFVVMKMTASVVMLMVPCMWWNREIGEMCPV